MSNLQEQIREEAESLCKLIRDSFDEHTGEIPTIFKVVHRLEKLLDEARVKL